MKLLLSVFLFFSSFAFGQDSLIIDLNKEERKKMEFAGVYKSSLSLELGGKSGYTGVSYDLLLSRKWRLGLGIGYPGVGTDLKFHPFGVKRDKLILNIGMRANAFLPPTSSNYMFYSLPIGLTYYTVNRLNLEIDAGPMFKTPLNPSTPQSGFGNDINYIWFSLKIGYRFSFYAIRRARLLDKQK